MGDTPRPLLVPKNAVVLFYNCHYMKAICQNAIEWLGTTEAKGRMLQQYYGGVVQSTYMFGYDLNSKSTDDRGNAQCPSSWKNSHSCPETNQPNVMPGPWYTTSREMIDPIQVNEIAASYTIDPRDPTKLKLSQRSGRYYTCEEWPPRRSVSQEVSPSL